MVKPQTVCHARGAFDGSQPQLHLSWDHPVCIIKRFSRSRLSLYCPAHGCLGLLQRHKCTACAGRFGFESSLSFMQGDRERAEGLTASPLCDRQRVDVPKSQLTFLDYVVRPTFEALHSFAPATSAAALRNIEAAKQHWEHLQQRAQSGGSATVFAIDDV